MRVAFSLFGGSTWTGGIHYLANLFSALADMPNRPIEPILFIGLDVEIEAIKLLTPYLSSPPIQLESWTKGTPAYYRRMFYLLTTQKDIISEEIFKQNDIDIVFQHATFYGRRFVLPTLLWIADTQHRCLPDMFDFFSFWKREIGLQIAARCATKIMVSSQSEKQNCQKFYPFLRLSNKVVVLPFSVQLPKFTFEQSQYDIKLKYTLPDKFIFFPSQFWKHKNHFHVVKALEIIKNSNESVVIVISGNPVDHRNPNYPQSVLELIKSLNLIQEIKILGFIPYEDIVALMRASIAVLNPSFYEGWSTTVEEAKALGVPLLLSNIPVHQEQSPLICKYFNPSDPKEIADILLSAWTEWQNDNYLKSEQQSANYVQERKKEFAENFLSITKKIML